MKGISLLLGNDMRTRITFPRKRTKLNTTNGKDRTKTIKKLVSNARSSAEKHA